MVLGILGLNNMNNKDYSVDIISKGRPLTKYLKDSNIFVIGTPGDQYIIQLKNNTTGRLNFVISIDGLSVIDGKPASKSGSGYIVKCFNAIDISGWRINDKEVASFMFSNIKDSYNNKTNNDKNNIGVIGVVCYKEYKENLQYLTRGETYHKGMPYKSCSSSDVGTAFGNIINSEVELVSFKRDLSSMS